MIYRWWTVCGGRERDYTWLKLGPISLLWGRFLTTVPQLQIEVHGFNHLLWSSY